ncbi:VWA domain-containing protein [candidate division KSB1 bacterium]|nr:VWA domain-containing protein [candidate division KSB1 bacterium]
MKRLIVMMLALVLLTGHLYANGVTIVDARKNICLKLLSSDVNVVVNNQVATVTSSQTFKNEYASDKDITYGFPIPEGAASVELRWFLNNRWYHAHIVTTSEDSTLPGLAPDTHNYLKRYLGEEPLFFHVPHLIPVNVSVIIELTYVQLLEYNFSKVTFEYPNDYHLIQTSALESETFNFTLNSPRLIDSLAMKSTHPVITQTNDGYVATLQSHSEPAIPDENFLIQYSLNNDDLGLFGISTMLPDSEQVDDQGGYFLFVLEPKPDDTTEVMNKVFTLIIDRSESMKGTKFTQAKDAASFIMNNLNEGDKFNIVDFETVINTFSDTHIEYTPDTKTQALQYIENLELNGGTNIYSAFEAAIPQFASADSSTANIIIFFTDGEATVNIKDTPSIVMRVQQLASALPAKLTIFTFGIGETVNKQLLTLLATQNDGVAEFLGDADLERRITEFYLQIRNPTLIGTEMSFTPDVLSDLHPQPLPNLYLGQQMVVTGRYSQPGLINLDITGSAFGRPKHYQFQMDCSDSVSGQNKFVTKFWAKQKIEQLLIEFYLSGDDVAQANAIKSEIISLSTSYRVICPFTSYYSTPIESKRTLSGNTSVQPAAIELIGNFPNPFNPSTTITFRIRTPLREPITINIYNMLGQVIRTLYMDVNGTNIYNVQWDGLTNAGISAPSGNYFYVIKSNDVVLSGQMQLLK